MRMLALCRVAAVVGACLCTGWLEAQIPLFSDKFDDDPTTTGWALQGSTFWVSPDADECFDTTIGPDDDGDGQPDGAINGNLMEGALPCTVYPGEGFIDVTPARNGQSGNIFRSEKTRYDNFKMTAVIEMREGSVGGAGPADGFCIVIIGTDQPPGIGCGGGAMGATGLGSVPTMIFEFDNWSCNNGDSGNNNHVAFAWERSGFPCVDSIAPDVFRPLDAAAFPLHNKQCGNDGNLASCPAEPNQYLVEALVQNRTVAFNAKRIFEGLDSETGESNDVDLGEIYNYTIPDFTPFDGYLGVTASTGDARQNHIIHSVSIESLPPGFCLQPAAVIRRDVQPLRNVEENCGDYLDGDVMTVELTFDLVRAGDQNCTAPSSVIVREFPPDGWLSSDISDGGQSKTIDGRAGIEWVVNTPALAVGKKVSYKLRAVSDGNEQSVNFSGLSVENIPLSKSTSTIGESSISRDTAYDECGGIKCWNILGGYGQLGGAGPTPDAIRADYLTDGSTSEADFLWFPGAQINTAIGVAGPSISLMNGARTDINPDGVPTVFAWNDPDGYVNLNDDVFGGNPDNVMGYQQAYLVVEEETQVTFSCSSDDSIQIILNGEEIWNHSIPRGGNTACNPQDIVDADGDFAADLHTLFPGENSLIVKTFEGGGGWNSAIRMENEDGEPINSESFGITITKFPDGVCPKSPFTAVRTIDTGATVKIQHNQVPAWEVDKEYTVSIALSSLRPVSQTCPAPANVTIRETVPAGWTPSNPSAGGQIQNGVVTFNVNAAGGLPAQPLTYKVRANDVLGNVRFAGEIAEPGSRVSFAVGGDSLLSNPSGFSALGFFQFWLNLGPYNQPRRLAEPGANPGDAAIRRDHLADGAEINEIDVEPEDGDTVDTAYSTAARSTSLAAPIGNVTPEMINPGNTPRWNAWRDEDDTMNFAHYYGGDGVDNVMMYSVIYVLLEEDTSVDIGLGSDDSVQVLLDGEEIHINNIPRGDGGANVVQDTILAVNTPALDPLPAGLHKLMVKVFEGGGVHSQRLRFQDPVTGEPITEGIKLCFTPDVEACQGVAPPQGVPFVRGDGNSDGSVNIADASFILNFLFLGGRDPACAAATDGNADGSTNIADASFILNFLFLGGRDIPAPVTCGAEPLAPSTDECAQACRI